MEVLRISSNPFESCRSCSNEMFPVFKLELQRQRKIFDIQQSSEAINSQRVKVNEDFVYSAVFSLHSHGGKF